ncbi:hypothetical protein, partial [Streptomyces sp. NPDC048256]|uniref:hypothetical protein n=1 Tax=Streptomyces sp. NPDC048256 TaxID=3154613 RepID=UPI0033DFEEAA
MTSLQAGPTCLDWVRRLDGRPGRAAQSGLAGVPGLLSLTKPLDVAVGDQADGEPEECFVDVVASF